MQRCPPILLMVALCSAGRQSLRRRGALDRTNEPVAEPTKAAEPHESSGVRRRPVKPVAALANRGIAGAIAHAQRRAAEPIEPIEPANSAHSFEFASRQSLLDLSMMGLWQRFRKSWVIRAYLRDCPELFCRRYGFEELYSTARVLATLSAAGLSDEFSEYACALFAGERDFVEWALNEQRRELKVPSWIRKQTHRRGGIRSRFPSTAPLSTSQARELYRSLRDEVAERYNHGRRGFMRRPSASFGDVSPLESSSYSEGGDRFRWYE